MAVATAFLSSRLSSHIGFIGFDWIIPPKLFMVIGLHGSADTVRHKPGKIYSPVVYRPLAKKNKNIFGTANRLKNKMVGAKKVIIKVWSPKKLFFGVHKMHFYGGIDPGSLSGGMGIVDSQGRYVSSFRWDQKNPKKIWNL